jgi:hypothetical protein
MTTLYRDNEVVVTHASIRIGGQSWRLSDLDYVWHNEVSADWRVRSRTAGRGILNILLILSIFAGIIVLIAIGSAAYLELQITAVPRNTLIVAAAVLLAAGLVPLGWEWALTKVDSSYDKGDAIYEMWARQGDTEFLLLQLDDLTRFSKIYRAVQRALEDDN